MQNFRRLVAWQRAHAVAVDACEFAIGLPMRYVRLADQILGAAASMPANLAEGCGRRTNADRARFFDFSAGSTSEVEALILIARDLKLMSKDDAARLCARLQEVRALIQALLRKLRPTRHIDFFERQEPRQTNEARPRSARTPSQPKKPKTDNQ